MHVLTYQLCIIPFQWCQTPILHSDAADDSEPGHSTCHQSTPLKRLSIGLVSTGRYCFTGGTKGERSFNP